VQQTDQVQTGWAGVPAGRANEPRARTREASMKIEITAHPAWVEELVAFLEPYGQRITQHEFFGAMADGSLGLERWQRALVHFYPLIETFPQYMALNLAKVPAGSSIWNNRARHWLILNIGQERVHANWWKQWAKGFGVPGDMLEQEVHPPASMDAMITTVLRSRIPRAYMARCQRGSARTI